MDETYNAIQTEELDSLEHYGIKGQKWGLRRYQNPDGSYTELGKERRRVGFEKESKDDDEKSKTSKSESPDIKLGGKAYKDMTRKELKAAKKRARHNEAERRAQREFNAEKRLALEKGDISFISKNISKFTNQEIDDFITRYKKMQDVWKLDKENKKDADHYLDKAIKYLQKVDKLSTSVTNIYNSFNESGKKTHEKNKAKYEADQHYWKSLQEEYKAMHPDSESNKDKDKNKNKDNSKSEKEKYKEMKDADRKKEREEEADWERQERDRKYQEKKERKEEKEAEKEERRREKEERKYEKWKEKQAEKEERRREKEEERREREREEEEDRKAEEARKKQYYEDIASKMWEQGKKTKEEQDDLWNQFTNQGKYYDKRFDSSSDWYIGSKKKDSLIGSFFSKKEKDKYKDFKNSDNYKKLEKELSEINSKYLNNLSKAYSKNNSSYKIGSTRDDRWKKDLKKHGAGTDTEKWEKELVEKYRKERGMSKETAEKYAERYVDAWLEAFEEGRTLGY